MIGSQAGIWAMTGKDKKTPVIGRRKRRERQKPQAVEEVGFTLFFPFPLAALPRAPLTQDPALLQSSPSVRISFLIKAWSLGFKIYGSRQIPQSREL